MKLVISSSELLKGLMTISKAIPAKTTEAILEDYLFVLNGNRLEVTASDKEITMKTTIEVETPEEEGRIAVPARQLNDLLKELPGPAGDHQDNKREPIRMRMGQRCFHIAIFQPGRLS